MTFEEDFPSLKGKIDGGCNNCKAFGPCVDTDDIQNHCFDKQRVREAIEKLGQPGFEHGFTQDENEKIFVFIDELKKELGL